VRQEVALRDPSRGLSLDEMEFSDVMVFVNDVENDEETHRESKTLGQLQVRIQNVGDRCIKVLRLECAWCYGAVKARRPGGLK
jgi:hypothetical protein